ncbi:MAG TPA: hypothetical protein VG269_14825 [Tepidisphaeraceae bacterium]|jgi:hypothetical protein|nr:hypothetical protein [Tepidisphaeraceae bacterium]
MPEQVIEGTWEEVVQRHDLRGHRVKVIVIDEVPKVPADEKPWIEQVRAWAESHDPVGHFVDDSR